MKLNNATRKKIIDHVTEANDDALWKWVDQYCTRTGHAKEEVAATVGLSAMIQASTMIGLTLNLTQQQTWQIVEHALRSYNQCNPEFGFYEK